MKLCFEWKLYFVVYNCLQKKIRLKKLEKCRLEPERYNLYSTETLRKNVNVCETSGSHGCEYHDDSLLGYSAVWSHELYRRFGGAYCLHHQIALMKAVRMF
jgi:hypothetical protein